jgi:hypothetical protein
LTHCGFLVVSVATDFRTGRAPHLDIRYQPTEWRFTTDPLPPRVKW